MSIIKVKNLESLKDIFEVVDEPEYSKNSRLVLKLIKEKNL